MKRNSAPTTVLITFLAAFVLSFAHEARAVGCSFNGGRRCPDLDVTYIERTPRYYRYALDYSLRPGDPWRMPRLCAGTENNKRWPELGEPITYIAHVLNKGNKKTSSRFDFQWRVNGIVVKEGVATSGPLKPGEEATFDFPSIWPASPETIEFRVDARNRIAEMVESNNSLTIRSNALTFAIWVEEELYTIFNNTPNLVGSRSFEDWIQAQLAKMNERFDQARYPVATKGILDRVRIDKMVVRPELDADLSSPPPICAPRETDPDELLIDGGWSFTDGDPTNAQGIGGQWQAYVNQFVTAIDFGLMHELAHQLGVIDLYRMNLVNEPASNYRFQVEDVNGEVIPASNLPTFGFCQLLFRSPGLMAGGDTSPYNDGTYFESHTAGGLNSHFNYRRGYFGEYLFDTPDTTFLQVVDSDGNPLAGVDVRLYQKDALNETFDNIPEIVGTTDAAGRMQLPNRAVVVPITTATGHVLRANPFGQIFHEGENGTMFVKVSQDNLELYGWIFILDLNLAYWMGNREAAEVSVVVLPAASHQCQ